MLDKIRLQERGELPAEYQPNLGKGFDESCIEFLHLRYDDVVARTKAGGSDEEILAWCFAQGRRPTDGEIHVWNEFMRKRGWNDDVTPTLRRRKEEAGFSDRAHLMTMFGFIDADEDRAPA